MSLRRAASSLGKQLGGRTASVQHQQQRLAGGAAVLTPASLRAEDPEWVALQQRQTDIMGAGVPQDGEAEGG